MDTMISTGREAKHIIIKIIVKRFYANKSRAQNSSFLVKSQIANENIIKFFTINPPNFISFRTTFVSDEVLKFNPDFCNSFLTF